MGRFGSIGWLVGLLYSSIVWCSVCCAMLYAMRSGFFGCLLIECQRCVVVSLYPSRWEGSPMVIVYDAVLVSGGINSFKRVFTCCDLEQCL